MCTDPLFCLEFAEIARRSVNPRGFEKARTQGVGPGERRKIEGLWTSLVCGQTNNAGVINKGNFRV